MTKRFDRADGKKVHMQSLGSLAHISYQEPGICGYELASRYMKELDLTAAEIEQFYRRMVFNVLAVNQDDHVKNVSFLMDRSGEWTLSPAYDITFSYDAGNKWLRAHQMTINGKTDNIELNDLLEAGKAMEIREHRCKDIINDIQQVVSDFSKYASKVGIKDSTTDYICSVIGKSAARLSL